MKKWDDLTKQERAVEIAKDAKKHIQANLYNIRRDFGYVEPLSHNFKVKSEGKVMKADVKHIAKSCGMCARGALFLSRINKFDAVAWEDVVIKYHDGEELSVGQSDTTKFLSGAFTGSELRIIESHFEHSKLWHGDKTDDEILLVILQNIIDNEGLLRVSELREYEICV